MAHIGTCRTGSGVVVVVAAAAAVVVITNLFVVVGLYGSYTHKRSNTGSQWQLLNLCRSLVGEHTSLLPHFQH